MYRSPRPLLRRCAPLIIALALVVGLGHAADLTVTDTTTKPATGASFQTKVAAVAIKAGQVVYLNGAKLDLADANASSTTARAVGVAVCNAAADQPVTYVARGDLTLGTTMVVGKTYVASATAGMICPIEDLTTGDYITILGEAKTTTVITLRVVATGVKR